MTAPRIDVPHDTEGPSRRHACLRCARPVSAERQRRRSIYCSNDCRHAFVAERRASERQSLARLVAEMELRVRAMGLALSALGLKPKKYRTKEKS